MLIAGVLCKRIISMLDERFPQMFHLCSPGMWQIMDSTVVHEMCTDFVEGTARIYEARLHRDQSEGKIIDYKRIADSGYHVISKDAITSKDTKVTDVLRMY